VGNRKQGKKLYIFFSVRTGGVRGLGAGELSRKKKKRKRERKRKQTVLKK
jgi:hypothetical protein